jgi:hypothetical protein
MVTFGINVRDATGDGAVWLNTKNGNNKISSNENCRIGVLITKTLPASFSYRFINKRSFPLSPY